jgi:transposase
MRRTPCKCARPASVTLVRAIHRLSPSEAGHSSERGQPWRCSSPASGMSVSLSEAQQAMKELSSRRDQLIEAISAEKKRLRRVSHEAVRASLESQIAFLEREVKRIESAIEETVAGDEATRATAGILVSIPGVGKLTAHLMAIELPELGRLGDKQIASLAGVAPHPDESGKYRGKAFIRGGRPRVRAKLYMAAFNARRYNPVIGGFYARLVAKGKTFKQALTACMRKLLVLMNTLVARGQVWSPSYAT